MSAAVVLRDSHPVEVEARSPYRKGLAPLGAVARCRSLGFMVHANLGSAIGSAPGGDPAAVSAVLDGVGREFGASDLVVYLVDFGQVVLEPLGDYSTHAELPHSEEVATTMAGR